MGAARLFRHTPGLAAAIVGMLAPGTAVLAWTLIQVDAALVRPPDFFESGRLVLLYNLESSPRTPERRVRWSWREVQLLRSEMAGTVAVANYSPSTLPVTFEDGVEGTGAEMVAPAYFTVLGARPLLGRILRPDEDSAAGGAPVVLLSHAFWQRRFSGDSAVLGRALRVAGRSLTIVGVMRPGFVGVSGSADLWVPATMAPLLSYPEYLTTPQHFISAIGRLEPGVTLAQAERRLEVVAGRVAAIRDPSEVEAGSVWLTRAMPLNQARVTGTTRNSLLLLLGGAVLLYLLTVANVINLLLARAASRTREAAVRLALGGTSWQRVRDVAGEGIVLALAGTALGCVLAWLAAPLLALPPEGWGPRSLYGSLGAFSTPVFGLRALAIGVTLALLTALLVSWPPAVALLRPPLSHALRDGAGVTAGGATLRRLSLRGVIVALEAALAVVLLVVGGLLLESFRRMRGTELGITPDGVLSFWIRPSEAQVTAEDAPAFITRVLAAIEAIPGVEAATVDGGGPLSGSARSTLFIAKAPPARPEDAPRILRHYVAPRHFQVLGVPLLRGRVFTDEDRAGSPRVAIISQSAAERFWPGRDPLGERIWFGGGLNFNSAETSAEIVGVVGDVAYEPLDVESTRWSFYTPYRQFTWGARAVLVRTRGDPLALVPAIRKALLSVHPDVPIVEVRTLRELIGDSWARQRFDATLFGVFGTVALLLASAGVSAVVAYSVSRRRQEMGLRLALGATPARVRRLVVWEGLRYPVIGLVLGVPLAVACTRLVRGALYQVAPGNPVVPLVAVGLLLLAAVAGCLVPAWRAARIDPATTLRAE